MIKNKRIITLMGLDKSLIKIFSSYCHLLKLQLKDRWVVVSDSDKQAEIILVNSDYKEPISKKVKVKLVLGKMTELNEEKNGPYRVFNINFPIRSADLVNILNTVSEIKSLKSKSRFKAENVFSLKNMFLNFLNKDEKKKRVKVPQKKPHLMANKLLNLLQPNAHKSFKVVFLGRPGSGKTTAIMSASTNKMLNSEVNATDSVGLLKDQTTIGIDYGEYEFGHNVKLRLYGTPGQVRYDYVQTQTVANADIYIILIDLSSAAPFSEFMYYKNIIESAGNSDALWVAAFTHYDVKEHNMIQLSKEIRHKCYGEILTVKIDTREEGEMRFMLNKVAGMKLGETPPEQYYADNNLFLKNINP